MSGFIKQKQNILLVIILFLGFFLRSYQVDKLPPGLYDDEVSIGYNAYSILKYGHDEYGESYPLWFKAFGEYKLPVYIYVDAVSIAIFGKNEFAVRFPSVLFGTLTILFLYLFLKNLISLEDKKIKEKLTIIPLTSAFILSILPWHIHFSRAAYESTIAVCFYIICCWQFIVFYKNKKLAYLLVSIFFLTLCSYTYNSFRLITPITMVIFFFLILKERIINKKNFLLITLFTTIVNIPLILFTLNSSGYTRLAQTSILTQSNIPEAIYYNGIKPLTILDNTKNFLIYPFVFIKNYLSFFSFQELFIRSNDNVRFYSSSEFGFLFKWMLPFLIIGFLTLLKEKMFIFKKSILLIFFLTPLTIAITVSPNALRGLLLTIPFSVLISLGILQIIIYKKIYLKIGFILIFLFAIYETLLYFHMYNSHYNSTHVVFWGGAEKKIVEEVTRLENKYHAIVIVEDLLPNQKIHFLFYNEKLKPLFVNSSWQKPKEWSNKKTLYIKYPTKNIKNPNYKVLETITLDTKGKESVAELIEL